MADPLRVEWACRVERYATKRLAGAKRARDISARYPDSEAAAWRAAYLTRTADEWLMRALAARDEARR